MCDQGGNIIVTDQDLNILVLLRVVHEGQGQEQQKIGLRYAIEQRQNYAGVPPLTKERVKEALEVAIKKAATAQVKKPKPGAALRKGLATTITEVPPVLTDHVLQANGFDVMASLEDILASEEKVELLFKALQQGREIADETASSEKRTGYIIAKKRPGVGPKEDGSSYKREELLYEDYHPFLPHKFANNPDYEILTYDNYNKTVDEFHSSIEGQKLESKVHEREETAKRKLNAARQDQEKRIEGLQEAQLLNIRKAAAIETNVEWVQEAMNSVNGLLESGMDWVDVGKLVEREQKHNNPVAQMIKLPLKLAENTITLLLNEEEEEEEDDGYSTQSSVSDSEDEAEEAAPSKTPKLTVDINLGITPWANATSYHDQRRTAAEKEKKTAQQSERAMKSAEQKVKLDLKKGLKQEKPLMQPLRQQMWFDKFHWFVSSDGYLVIAGKDAVQHEMLYTRHLRKGDIFCHADVEGAAPAIIKNSPTTADAPIPPSTLSQAGILSISTSTAWESKAVMAAWWVKAEQVSKTLPGGQILSPGNFTIKGEKNFLPPSPLLVGFAVLFRVSEESREKHSKHRIYEAQPEEAEEGEDDAALAAEAAEREENASMDANDDEKMERMEEKVEDGSDGETDDEDSDMRQRENPLQSSGAQNNEGTEEGAESKAMADLSLAEDTAEAPKEQEESAAATESNPNDTSELQTSAPSSRPGSTAPSQKKQQQQQQPKRGQRAKAKKIAAKYRHQDEEDREAIEALIGATAGRQRAEEAAKEKARREAEAEAQRERRRAQHVKQQERAAEHEAKRRRVIEEGLDEPLEKERLGIVEELVGTPLPGDEVLEAIPICAPWAALGKVKYRVKLQPGSIKRGKAVKEILERWKAESERKGVVDPRAEDAEKMWPREVELVKGLRPEEAVGVVPVGRVTVMMAGGKAKGKGQQGKGGKKKK